MNTAALFLWIHGAALLTALPAGAICASVLSGERSRWWCLVLLVPMGLETAALLQGPTG